MLSRKQYRKLRKISILGGTEAKDYDKNKDLYDYLFQCGYLKRSAVRGYQGYVVTQSGFSAIHAYKTENFRFWFPSVISVLALVSSFLAIFL